MGKTTLKKFFVALRISISAVFMLLLGGCPAIQLLTGGVNPFAQFMGMPGGPKGDTETAAGPEIEIEKLTIVAQPDANGGTPVWVAVALIYKNGPINELKGMDAKTFQDKWKQLMRDYPQRIEVFDWEVAPPSTFTVNINKTGSKPIAGFIFAEYDKGGANRLQLATGIHIRLVLKKDEPWYDVVND